MQLYYLRSLILGPDAGSSYRSSTWTTAQRGRFMTFATRRSDLAQCGPSSLRMLVAFFTVSGAVLGQGPAQTQTTDKVQQAKSVPKNADTNSRREKDTGDA